MREAPRAARWAAQNHRRTILTLAGAAGVLLIAGGVIAGVRFASFQNWQDAHTNRTSGPPKVNSADSKWAQAAYPDVSIAASDPSGPVLDIPPATPDTSSDATTVAVTAVNAWLRYDMTAFAQVATPQVLENAAASPKPAQGQTVSGAPHVTLGGPTQQTIDITTTAGVIRLTVATHDGRWLIDDMRYLDPDQPDTTTG